MLIQTKFSIGESIWFISGSNMYCSEIHTVEASITSDGTRAIYICNVLLPGAEKELCVVMAEHNAYATKDELINSITERYYQSLEKGAS